MGSEAKRILQHAMSLPDEDRQRLAEALLDSLPIETAKAIESAWNEEVVRRAEALERGEVETVDGMRALDELRAKLGSSRDA